MTSHTPPSYHNGLMSPPTSTTSSLHDHASNSESVLGSLPISPSLGTKPLQQSYTSNSRSVQGFSPSPRSATMGHPQAQMWPARYYDGPQMASPPPTVSSPELIPSWQNPQLEDPDYLEWLREKNLKKLDKEKQGQQTPVRTQTPEQHDPEQQYRSEQQPFSQPRPDPQQRRNTEPQPHQQQHHLPQQSYPQQQQHYSQQQHQSDRPYSQPQPDPQQWRYTEQQTYSQQQRDQYYKGRYQQELYQPAAQHPFPPANLPLHLTRQMPQRNDSGHTSRTTSIDDYAQRVPPNYQGYPMNFPSEQSWMVAPRTGHKYGKITIRDNAKVLMGNGTDSNSTTEECFHEYGDVEASSLANVVQGNMPVTKFREFFGHS